MHKDRQRSAGRGDRTRRKGQSIIEYLLVVGLILAAIILFVPRFNIALNNQFNTLETEMNAADVEMGNTIATTRQ